MKHRDYVAEQMRDPRYRFWHYVYAPEFWLRGKLISFLFWLRDAADEAACRVLGVRLVDLSPTESLGPTEASAGGE